MRILNKQKYLTTKPITHLIVTHLKMHASLPKEFTTHVLEIIIQINITGVLVDNIQSIIGTQSAEHDVTGNPSNIIQNLVFPARRHTQDRVYLLSVFQFMYKRTSTL